jgi:putative inorganic carbon (hco3(-)) transporter
MRGLILGAVFFGLLPLVFTRGPFVGILMWYWVSLMNPQRDVWGGIFGSLPYALIVALATLSSLMFSRREPKFPPADKVTLLIVLLMVWTSVTSLLGIGPHGEILDLWQLGEKMLLMTLVAYALTTTRERLDQLILVCVASVAVYGVKGGVFSLMTGGGNHVLGPAGSMIADNNDLGVALTMVLPMMFYLRERYRHPLIRHAVLGFIGLTLIGDIFTYSRGALVALSAMGSVLWLRSSKKLSILVIIAVAAVGIWHFAPAAWVNRMATIQSYQKDGSAEARLRMWQRSWAVAMRRPIFGAGYHWSYDPIAANNLLSRSSAPMMETGRAVHSSWFEMLSNHGFIGLALFVAILGSAFFDAQWLTRHSRRDPALSWANHLGRMMPVALIGFSAGASFATQGMYDGLYVMVIIAAAARRIVAAELASRTVAVRLGTNLAVARPGGALTPQPSG